MRIVHVFVYRACVTIHVFLSSFCCHGFAAACFCGTPFTFSVFTVMLRLSYGAIMRVALMSTCIKNFIGTPE